MNGSNFRELEVWKKARILVGEVYGVTRAFPREEVFGLTQQRSGSALSIVCNIAEGKGRYTRAEYRSFLVIARGSAFEIDAQTIIAHDLEYLDRATAEPIVEKANEIARMLNAIIKHLTPL